MPLHIDYYASLNSPWTHLGAQRIEDYAARYGASLRIYPVDVGTIFPASGGFLLPQRSPQRRAYRMMELRRWRDALDIPINLEPKHFPSSEALSSSCVIALRETAGDNIAVEVAHRVLKAVWEEELNPADPEVLGRLIRVCDLDPRAVLALAADPKWAERRNADTQVALDRGVFGVPSYVIDNEIFWGQDRLDFVARRLTSG
ncbi:MAG: 2-hydroxychromene-2-carboxylate isomerase [Acetobacteraceae bacterium]|nr:2-hydroxychromene-2-carboxylate isomerase [Acetobacteraceae bacterium]